MRRKAKTMVPPLQQAEFDALPYSVQRKYFSTLERLQIRQHSLDEQNASGCSSRASSSGQLHPSLTLASQQQQQQHHSQAQLQPHCHQLSTADTDFFLALPEKLRKLYFSREEQVLLQGSYAGDLSLKKDQDFERARQRFSDFHFGFSKDQDSGSYDRGRSRRRSLSESSLESPGRTSFSLALQVVEDDAKCCKDRRNTRNSSSSSSSSSSNNNNISGYSPRFRLDSMNTSSSKASTPAYDLRRTMSLSNTPVRHYTTSTAMIVGAPSAVLMADPPIYAMPLSTRHQRAQSSLSTSGRRSFQTPSPPVFDPEATHYQDPEARKKLRMYLASPQKFDEAIEFGFPSIPESNATIPHYQLPPIAGHARKFSQDMQNFLKDGKLSFFEEHTGDNLGLESDEEASVLDAESPVTPSSAGPSFGLHSRHVSHSMLSSEGPSDLPTLLLSGGKSNREMTLRMTLTRPDLRADDDQLYGWQSPAPKVSNDDPLALEELVLTDDMTGTKGPFYVKPKPRGNLVTRMLKRASLKGR